MSRGQFVVVPRPHMSGAAPRSGPSGLTPLFGRYPIDAVVVAGGVLAPDGGGAVLTTVPCGISAIV